MTPLFRVTLPTALVFFAATMSMEAQPTFVKQIPDASSNFFAAGNFVYFTSHDSLFRTDGTEAGTIFLKSGLRFEHAPRFAQYKDLLIFIVFKSLETGEREIWRSDGTPGGTSLLQASGNYDLVILGVAGKYLYFSAASPGSGSELFRSDGTTSGTVLLKDIYPGPGSGFPRPLTSVGDELFFVSNDGVHGRELWKTDGSAPGTVMVKDINPGLPDGIGESVASAFNNRLYFTGINGDTGAEPWVSDGTTSGTFLLKDLLPGENSYGTLAYGKDNNGWLYFTSLQVISEENPELPVVEVDLWRTDGSTTSTTKIQSFSTRCTTCAIRDYWTFNDRLYFFLSEAIDRDVLYATDGTATGTMPVFSLASSGVFAGEENGKLIFFDVGNYLHAALYRTDGTLTGTHIVRDIISRQVSFVKIGHTIYFTDHDTVYDPAGGYSAEDEYQLMQSDGFTTKSIRSMGGGSFARSDNLINLNGMLIFTTKKPARGEPIDSKKRLWLLDPSRPFEKRGSFTLVDADADADLQTLKEGDIIFKSADLHYNIRFNPATTPGSVVFKVDGNIVGWDNTAPYSLAGDNNGDYFDWSDAVPGVHRVEATPYSGTGGTGMAGPALVVNFTITDQPFSCKGSGSILREYWEGIPGNRVSSIPLDQPATGNSQLLDFEGPTNAGVNYGARISGYICAPVTGNYIFRIASNNESELWLSDDDNPDNKRRIAYTRYATDPRQWDKYPSQSSGEIWLVKGARYYVEAIHKQGTGTDHIAVGWQLPYGQFIGPISGYNLSPLYGEVLPEVRITIPTQGQEFYGPTDITVSGIVVNMTGWLTMQIFNGETQLAYFGTDPSFGFTWERVPPGTYQLKVVVSNDIGQIAESVVTVVVKSPCSATGTITREQWDGISGYSVRDIPVQEDPSAVTELTVFETGALGRNYGARIRGFICPPATGDYVFWIASNNQSELWLSTDDNPANVQHIAHAIRATNFREWNMFRRQRSKPIRLIQGQKYYIEALHKQGVGADHLSVGWQLPDGTLERPIGANRLSPFNEQSDLLSHLILPVAGSNGIDPLVVRLETKMVEGSTRYTVELNTRADFSGESKILTSADDHQNRFIIKDLNHTTTYYARVKTDVVGFGPVTTFTTRNEIARMRLWGIASYGGENNVGTIFSYSIDDNSFVKHYDQPVYWDGYYNEERLYSPLVPGPDGTFYGHREENYGAGMFEMDSQGNVEWWGGSYFQNSQLLLASNSHIYSTTDDNWEPGIIDKFDIDRKILLLESRMHFFTQLGGPSTPLIELTDGYLYGARGSGGVNEGGFIYKFHLNGSGFQIIHYFHEGSSGMKPYAGLIEYNGFLYGTTTQGGDYGSHGTIFRIRPDGTGFLKLHDFDGANGSTPKGELVVLNDVLYGTTDGGGASGTGTVFRINPDGTGYSMLHSFNGTNGADPSRGLVHDQDGNLYGMTSSGGANNMGVIFKVSTTGSGFTKLFDFSNDSGGTPNGALVIREDTYNPGSVAHPLVEETAVSITVHPNPSSDDFRIHVNSSDTEKIELVVMDQYGQVISTSQIRNNNPMRFGAELKRGFYIIKVVQGKDIAMRRLVKN